MEKNVTDPFVSVVMPVYNSGRHLKNAIDSILIQSYKNFEFIIINDGSTDNSVEIINSYADTRIKIILNDSNKGLIFSLNKAINFSTGKYIVRMDADDLSLPERICEQVKFMENNPEVGVCGCNYTIFGESVNERVYVAEAKHDAILSQMIFNSSIVHPSLILRRSVLPLSTDIYDKNFIHAEDYALWSELIFQCKFSAVNKTLFKYRLHDGQVTSVHTFQQNASADNVRKNILTKLEFVYAECELNLLNRLGEKKLLTKKSELFLLEMFFKKLIAQNIILDQINSETFGTIISYKWYSACGFTTLGLSPVIIYLRSSLRKLNAQSTFKLIVKCLVRYFKKR